MEHGDTDSNGFSDSTGSSARGGIITARGTGSGLIIRVDGRVKRDALKDALFDFLNARKSFLSGNEVTIEWVAAKPDDQYLDELTTDVFSKFDVKVRASKLRTPQRASLRDGDTLPNPSDVSVRGVAVRGTLSERVTSERLPSSSERGIDRGVFGDEPRRVDERRSPRPVEPRLREAARETGKVTDTILRESPHKESTLKGVEEMSRNRGDGGKGDDSRTMSLFDGIEAMGFNDDLPTGTQTPEEKIQLAAGAHLWDDPDCRLVCFTLRSGQKIETEHSVVIVGDVNSGAEVIAGGDIIVLGTLRGVAHAGAYDESGGGRFIFALNLLPTQLRIGGVISRGSGEGNRGQEIARIEGSLIVVEPYQSRIVWGLRRDA